MNTKKYIILLSIIIILSITLVLTVIFKDKGYRLPKLSKINNEITQIEINKGEEDVIILKKEGDNWVVNGKYKADYNTLSQMVGSLTKSEISDIISRGDKNSLLKYELNNTNTLKVKAIDKKGKEVRNFSLGIKAALTYQTYAQIKNDKNIYLLTSDVNLKDVFETTEDNLRNKVVVNINNADITKLIITETNNLTFSLTRMANTKSEITNVQTEPYYYQAEYSDLKKSELPANKVMTYLQELSSITASGFLNDDFAKTNVNFSININYNETNNVNYSLYYPIDGKYEIVLEGDSVRYYIDENKAKKILNALTTLKN